MRAHRCDARGAGTQKAKQKPQKGQFERNARISRNELLDALFRAFQERERWSIKALRERTQQPEAYLKEVLSEVAFLHRSGEFNGNWELMANYKGEGVRVFLVLFFPRHRRLTAGSA